MFTQAASCGILVMSLTATGRMAPPAQKSFAVFGRVTTSDGSPARRDTMVSVMPVDGDGSSGRPVEADGTFRVEDLTPGRYLVYARASAGERADGAEGGFTMITVGAQDAGPVHLRTTPMHSIQGHVRFESDDPNPVRPLQLHLLAAMVLRGGAAEMHASGARPRSDGSFTLYNLLGPTIVRFGMELQPGHFWYPGPVLLDGKDITNVPTDFAEHQGSDLEVVFTQRCSAIAGRARDASGTPVPGAYVIATSTESSLQEVWSSTTMATQADEDGRYWMNLPAGPYLLAAVAPTTFLSWDHARRNFAAVKAVASPADVQDAVCTYRDLTLVKPTKPIRPLPESRAVVEVR